VRTLVDHPDPARANADALDDLNGGAASLLVTLDASGEAGVAVGSRADLERVLEGVLLDLAPVALDAGWMGPLAADWLADLAKGGPAAPLRFNMDPLGTWARSGSSPGPVEAQVRLAAETGARHAETYPLAGLFLASGRAVHEAGGSEGQELGFAAAAAIAYARALQAAGLNPSDAWGRITLGLSADVEHLTTAAKLRAARVIWGKLTAACGVEAPVRIEARSSRRMLSTRDSWTNLLRLTVAGFGAALGGAEAVVLEPFTAPLQSAGARPSPLARRQARNTQLVLMEEAGLGRVADAAGGSGWIEARTDELARAGWAVMQAIEAEGGLLAALGSGWVAEAVAAKREARRADYAEDRLGLIGVTRFPNKHDEPPALEPVDPAAFARTGPDLGLPGPGDACPPLRPIRWAEPFETGEGD
jgi:methylmalonyl-CoA mutase